MCGLDLKEIEGQINEPDRYEGLPYQLVEDAMQAALLARGLELPRVEVESRLERALKLAREARKQTGGDVMQVEREHGHIFGDLYDFVSFNRVYDEVQALALESPRIRPISS